MSVHPGKGHNLVGVSRPKERRPGICPECFEAGETSTAKVIGVTPRTAMGISVTYDAQGNRKVHDPNRGGDEILKCSNGHEWIEEGWGRP